MLILLLVVGRGLARGSRPFPYSPEISSWPRERASDYPGLDGTPYTVADPEQTTAGYPAPHHLGRGIKLYPSNGLSSESKLVIAYCCLRSGFTSYISKLGMLAYPFYLLSNPYSPVTVWVCVWLQKYKNNTIIFGVRFKL